MKKSVSLILLLALFGSGSIFYSNAQEPNSSEKKQEENIPAVFSDIETLMQEEKFTQAIQKIDAELDANPKDYRLVMLKSFILFKNLNQAEQAEQVIDRAIEQNPQVFDLYDFKLQLIRQQKPADMDEKMMQVYRLVAKNYANNPAVLSELGLALLKQQLGEMRLVPAILLLQTAKANMNKSSDSQKFLICTNLARGYYFASRADLAKEEQIEALEYASNEVEEYQGEELRKFYAEAEEMAKKLK